MAEGIWKITKILFFATGRGGGLQQDGWTECQTVLCGPGEGLQEADEPQDRGLHPGKGQDKLTVNNIKINDLCMKLTGPGRLIVRNLEVRIRYFIE